MSTMTGSCYCGDLRYEADGDTLMRANAIAANANIFQAAPPIC